MTFEELLDKYNEIEALNTEYCLLCNHILEDAFFNHESFEPLKIGELPKTMVGLNILGKFAGHYIIISQHVPDNNVLIYPMKYLFNFQLSGIDYFKTIIKKEAQK